MNHNSQTCVFIYSQPYLDIDFLLHFILQKKISLVIVNASSLISEDSDPALTPGERILTRSPTFSPHSGRPLF